MQWLIMKVKYFRYILFVFFVFLISIFVVTGENTVRFRNLNDEYGMSIREANSVCSDLNGFIWISSKMGVVRYSANEIKSYQLPVESVNVLTTSLTFSNDQLYVYTNNGQIFTYDALKDRFVLELNMGKVLRQPYLTVSKILVDSTNCLWIGSTAGLFCYDFENGLKSMAPNGDIYYLDWYGEDKLLLAVNNGDLVLFDPISYSTELFYRFPEGRLGSLSRIYSDQKAGVVWLGTMEEGCYALKIGPTKELVKLDVLPNQPIMSIQNCIDSTLLIGIDGQGIWEINKSTFELISVMKEDADNPNSLKGNGVYDIYCAPDNRVWVCTYSGGVSFFDISDSEITNYSHEINNTNSLVNNDVNSVLEDSNGNLWFATNNGISLLNKKTNKWKAFFHNKEKHAQTFLKLFEDSKDRIWASTYSSGVYILDKNNGKLVKHLSHELTEGNFAGDFVFEIFEEDKKNVWLGGVRGDLICYNIETDTYRSFEGSDAFALTSYNSEKLLVGERERVKFLDKNSGVFEVLIDGFALNDMYLKNDVVWIATSGDGVLKYNIKDKIVTKFTVDSGLPSNYVNSIEYYNGDFWLGTEQGLCKLNEEDLTIQSFNSILHLGQVAFNQNSHCILKNGNLMMGTNKGALVFDPAMLKISPEEGRIYVQDISVSGRSIREIEELEPSVPIDKLERLSLKYFQNTISLELIPIGTTEQGIKFSWKMDGLDQQWSKAVNNKILSYSNIPKGDYTLRIRMLDGSNSNVIAERAIVLNMIPPYWEAWWFRLTILLLVLGVTAFLLFYYIDHLKKIHSEEKIRFFANTAHDIRTSLTLINGPVEELNKESGLSNKGHHYLHLATEQTQRLLKVVNQLMDFQKTDIGKEKLLLTKVDIVKIIADRVMMFESYAEKNNIDIQFNSNLPEFKTGVDETLLEKIVENLISNAIKYTHPNTIVQVTLSCFSGKWILEVKDQGIGISKKAQRQLFREYYRAENVVNSKIVGSGIGLLLVKNYVNLLGGRITCSSQLNVGSSFMVSVPTYDAPFSESENVTTGINAKPTIKQIQEPGGGLGSTVNRSANKTKMKVLIVEDNEYLRKFLEIALSDCFDVYLAEDGEQAWNTIPDLLPDLVVSDIMMPKLNGFELCSKIKSCYETSHLPVILLTSLSAKADQLHGIGLGADDYLTKPFDVTLLQQRIKTLIKNREVIREKALKLISRNNDDEVILENELNDKFLKRMIEVVNDNLTNVQFSKNDFASEMNVSASLLYKKIKLLTDLSPTSFIKSIRLKHSIELLKSKKYTVTEVSELCGFASVGYFSTVFRKYFGKSPSQTIE